MALVSKFHTAWKYKKELAYSIYLNIMLRSENRYIAIYLERPMHYNFLKHLVTRLLLENYRIFIFVSDRFVKEFSEMEKDGVTVLNSFILRRIPFRLVMTPVSGLGKTNFCNSKSLIAHFFHSIVSAHVVYKHLSFYGYDFLFCVGPHHVEEMKALHKLNDKPQYLIEYGYAITDSLIEAKNNRSLNQLNLKTVLFSPSWGVHNSLRKYGLQIVEGLLEMDYNVVLRPHPISFTSDKETIESIVDKYGLNPKFHLDVSIDSINTLLNADVMISDYSGVAFEYSLALLKPVVFMDGLRKKSNENWSDYLNREGIEVIYRDRIGYILDDVNSLTEKIELALEEGKQWEKRILKVRQELLFNERSSTAVAIRSIDQIYANDYSHFERLSNQ